MAVEESNTTNLSGTDVIVIGAGPAGLTAAYKLDQQGQTCTVFEANDVVVLQLSPQGRYEDFWHEILPLVKAADVQAGYVVRMPKAYRVYDETYRRNVDTIRTWIEASVPNVFPVGRNGMHRYNNQDHSMYTAMLAVENIPAGAALATAGRGRHQLTPVPE